VDLTRSGFSRRGKLMTTRAIPAETPSILVSALGPGLKIPSRPINFTVGLSRDTFDDNDAHGGRAKSFSAFGRTRRSDLKPARGRRDAHGLHIGEAVFLILGMPQWKAAWGERPGNPVRHESRGA
jgi:hypothetical protein